MNYDAHLAKQTASHMGTGDDDELYHKLENDLADELNAMADQENGSSRYEKLKAEALRNLAKDLETAIQKALESE